MARKDAGFTLVEILTVIGIMVMLGAIMLPVFGRAREGARRTECTSNLHQIAVALKLYKLDERQYPMALVEPNMGVGQARAIPAGEYWYGPVDGDGNRPGPGYGLASLYPDYISSLKTFRCANNPVRTVTDDPNNGPPTAAGGADALYASYNSYDGYDRLLGQMKYQRGWTLDTTDVSSYRRQLRWRYPPDDTVVTWCSSHREVRDPTDPQSASWTEQENSQDVVLYLDGHARVSKPLCDSCDTSGHASDPGQ